MNFREFFSNHHLLSAGLILISLLGAASARAQAAGTLSVMPTRVTLSDSDKSATLMLSNHGTKTIHYRLALVNMRMTSDGALEKTEDSSNSAKALLKFAPKEISIEPGSWQKVKIMTSIPEGLADGEYRSHLAFTPIAGAESGPSPTVSDPSRLRLELTMASAVTIPIFVNHGHLISSATLKDGEVVLDGKNCDLKFILERTGNKTVRGDCHVIFYPEGRAHGEAVGEISGLPLYFPNTSRTVLVPLSKDIQSLGAGMLEINFEEPGSAPIVLKVVLQAPHKG